jgi:acetyltransferase-like isoleucine patch superfamily enzyme
MLKLIKSIIKAILYRPRIKKIGRNSNILLPREIKNGRLIEVGDNCHIGKSLVIEPITSYGTQKFTPKIVIGNDVYIGRYCQIFCVDEIKIDDGCVLSEYLYISDSAHGFNPDGGLIMQQELESKGPIYLGKNTFVGYGVSIMPGVSLGKNCVVGINSVVTRSFPDFSMIAGSPAKLIKIYSQEKKEWISVSR